MAKYERFEDLPVWQEAAQLYNKVTDLIERHGAWLSSGYRYQLERAALSVSNNIAEGFERTTTAELNAFLAIARGSAGEVRSMIAVVRSRQTLRAVDRHLDEIGRLAESCARQLTRWTVPIDNSPVQGNRHIKGELERRRGNDTKARDYRSWFLRRLKPEHPLYNSPEAREARAMPNTD